MQSVAEGIIEVVDNTVDPPENIHYISHHVVVCKYKKRPKYEWFTMDLLDQREPLPTAEPSSIKESFKFYSGFADT